MEQGRIAEIEINGISSEGAGVGRVDGQVVFVPGALPGELARVKIHSIKKKYAHAGIEKLLREAPERCAPTCPLFGACGGCAWQHVDYAAELAFKQDIVRQALKRIGGVDFDIAPPMSSGNPLHYRNRVTLHVFWGDGVKLGFYRAGSHEYAGDADCLLLMPSLLRLKRQLTELLAGRMLDFTALRDVSLRTDSTGERLLLTLISVAPLPQEKIYTFAAELMRREPHLESVWQVSGAPEQGIFGGNWQHIAGETMLADKLGGLELLLSPGAFSQVNHAAAQLLYAETRRALATDDSETVLDVYCGAGGIGLFLADAAREIIGVESYAPAVINARLNAGLNGIDNISFITGTAEQALPELLASGVKPQAVVLDPPRAGCDKEALYALLAFSPRKIAYISCNPATLARDLALLTAQGYRLQLAQPVDMFSRTAHVECLALLTR